MGNTEAGKPRLGNTRWFQVFKDGIASLLFEKASSARLEQRKKFFETACNGGAVISWQEPTTQVLETSEELEPAAALYTAVGYLESGMLPEKPKLISQDAVLRCKTLHRGWGSCRKLATPLEICHV